MRTGGAGLRGPGDARHCPQASLPSDAFHQRGGIVIYKI
jgi:hypothetical protein